MPKSHGIAIRNPSCRVPYSSFVIRASSFPMTICPYCGAENIEGSDECDECQHSLTHIVALEPVSAVEKGLLRDRIEILQPRPPLTVAPDELVGAVLKKMIAHRTGCAAVV